MTKETAEKIVENIMNDIFDRGCIRNAMESIDEKTYK